jgi:hypothetical protein
MVGVTRGGCVQDGGGDDPRAGTQEGAGEAAAGIQARIRAKASRLLGA